MGKGTDPCTGLNKNGPGLAVFHVLPSFLTLSQGLPPGTLQTAIAALRQSRNQNGI